MSAAAAALKVTVLLMPMVPSTSTSAVPPLLVSVMMSVSVLMPICALVNLIDSTSTYPEDPPAMVMCPLVLEIARLVVPVCVSAAAFTDILRVPAISTLSSVNVIKSASPVLPIWLFVILTVST